MADSSELVLRPNDVSGWSLFVTASGKAVFMIDGGVTFVVGIFLERYSSSQIPLWVFAVILSSLIGIVLSLALAFAASLKQSRDHLAYADRLRDEASCKIRLLEEQKPTRTVRSVVAHHEPYPPCKCILIVLWSNSAALAINTAVSISYAEETHEHPLGEGLVRRMQEDGCAVVTVDTVYATSEKYIAQLLSNKELSTKLRIGIRTSLQPQTSADFGLSTPPASTVLGTPVVRGDQ